MARGKQAPTAKSMARAKSREYDALEMRKAGKTYDQIGKALGITREGARLAVSRSISALTLEVSESAAEVVRLELDRLDAMLAGLWSKAEKGDGAAVDRVLRIQERRAKLLGLDRDQPAALEPPQRGGDVPRTVAFRVMTPEECDAARQERGMLPAE